MVSIYSLTFRLALADLTAGLQPSTGRLTAGRSSLKDAKTFENWGVSHDFWTILWVGGPHTRPALRALCDGWCFQHGSLPSFSRCTWGHYEVPPHTTVATILPCRCTGGISLAVYVALCRPAAISPCCFMSPYHRSLHIFGRYGSCEAHRVDCRS